MTNARHAAATALMEMPASGWPLTDEPPEGIRVRRRAEAARWIDGSRGLWIAVIVGSGDAGSGMIFDTLDRFDL